MALNAKLYIPAEAAQFPAQFFLVYSFYFYPGLIEDSPHTYIIQYSAKDLKGTYFYFGRGIPFSVILFFLGTPLQNLVSLNSALLFLMSTKLIYLAFPNRIGRGLNIYVVS